MRHASMLLLAALLAVTAAIGASALDSGEARAAETVNVRTCTGGKIALKADEKRMLELHNQKRKGQGLRRLCVHPGLQRAARDHSQDMIRRDYFGHGNVGKRLKRHGYNWSRYGESARRCGRRISGAAIDRGPRRNRYETAPDRPPATHAPRQPPRSGPSTSDC